MGFKEAVKTCFAKYADFSGRASRSEFWWFNLFVIIVSVAAASVSDVLYALVALGTLLPVIAVATRRLHDVNKSGWWQLICLVPIIGFIIAIVWLAQAGEAGENRFGPRALPAIS